MAVPPGWQNPITTAAGAVQQNVLAVDLLPSRPELGRARLDAQIALMAAGQVRFTPIEVTPDGVIWDGHHGARAAADRGQSVTVKVVQAKVRPVGLRLCDLPVR